MRKNKRCVHCDEEMSYKEWVKYILHPNDFSWNKKKYCSVDCIRKASDKRLKEKREEKYGLQNSS